mmetsp:Transcript_14675/g.42227  ORF Transcript_14675/g.42227 Transcript_14675/m.42227 type:complete len:209 (-) Transcript_14675:14-640(-)
MPLWATSCPSTPPSVAAESARAPGSRISSSPAVKPTSAPATTSEAALAVAATACSPNEASPNATRSTSAPSSSWLPADAAVLIENAGEAGGPNGSGDACSMDADATLSPPSAPADNRAGDAEHVEPRTVADGLWTSSSAPVSSGGAVCAEGWAEDPTLPPSCSCSNMLKPCSSEGASCIHAACSSFSMDACRSLYAAHQHAPAGARMR